MSDETEMPDSFDIAYYDGLYMFSDPQKATIPVTKYHRALPQIEGLEKALDRALKYCPEEHCIEYPKAQVDWLVLEDMLPLIKAATEYLKRSK